jgi:hypothetical protein
MLFLKRAEDGLWYAGLGKLFLSIFPFVVKEIDHIKMEFSYNQGVSLLIVDG